MNKPIHYFLLFYQINRFSSLEEEYKSEIADVLKDYEMRMERKQAMVGTVTSTKCAKSLTVLVKHDHYLSKYNKYITRAKKFMAHDEVSLGRLGDLVRIIPCRAKSVKKRHVLIDIIRKNESTSDDSPQITAVDAEKAKARLEKQNKIKAEKKAATAAKIAAKIAAAAKDSSSAGKATTKVSVAEKA